MTRKHLGTCQYCGRLSLQLLVEHDGTFPRWRIPVHKPPEEKKRQCEGSGKIWMIRRTSGNGSQGVGRPQVTAHPPIGKAGPVRPL